MCFVDFGNLEGKINLRESNDDGIFRFNGKSKGQRPLRSPFERTNKQRSREKKNFGFRNKDINLSFLGRNPSRRKTFHFLLFLQKKKVVGSDKKGSEGTFGFARHHSRGNNVKKVVDSLLMLLSIAKRLDTEKAFEFTSEKGGLFFISLSDKVEAVAKKSFHYTHVICFPA